MKKIALFLSFLLIFSCQSGKKNELLNNIFLNFSLEKGADYIRKNYNLKFQEMNFTDVPKGFPSKSYIANAYSNPHFTSKINIRLKTRTNL